MAIIEFLATHEEGSPSNSSNDLLLLRHGFGMFGLSLTVIIAVMAAAGIPRGTVVPCVKPSSIGAAVFIILLVIARLCRTGPAYIMGGVDIVSSGGRREVTANFLDRDAAVTGVCPGDEITVPNRLGIVAIIEVARVAIIDYIPAQVATGILIVLRAVMAGHLEKS
jgi:hypothetical protein